MFFYTQELYHFKENQLKESIFVTLKKITAFIPHLFTSGNLFCGVLALVCLQQYDYTGACYLVMLAGFLDFCDGFVARLLKVSGEFGKQLDSLADVVTFGVVPAILLHMLAAGLPSFRAERPFVSYLPILIAVFSALRLAKFNLDPRQKTGFIGLPTPANAFWIISIPFLMDEFPGQTDEVLGESWFFVLFTALSCFLLVSEIPLMSLKIKGFGWGENKSAYMLVAICLLMIIFFKFAALALIIPIYILFSLIQNTLKKS